MTVARLLVYRRILLSLIWMVEEDLRARGWRCADDRGVTTQDRRAP